MKSAKNKFTNFIIVILLCCLGFCGYKLYSGFSDYWQDYLKSERAADAANTGKEIDFEKLKKKYPDLVGWIYCKGTRIDYPVVQSHDNKEYLSLGPDKKYCGAGSIFCDYRTAVPFEDPLTIVYGHHMRDGSMFHCLEDFKSSAYLKNHPVVYFYTENGGYKAEIICTSVIPAADDVYAADMNTEEGKEEFLNRVDEKAVARTGVEADITDNFVMLSTCSYEYNNARAVVVGKLEPLSEDEYASSNRERKTERKSKWEVFFMMIKDMFQEDVLNA